jgi:hypothetical protein
MPRSEADGSEDGSLRREALDSGPFESLLRNWKNPVFMPGQEVRRSLITSMVKPPLYYSTLLDQPLPH